jgi:hypothetical protein
MHSPAVPGILRRREHISVIALGALNLITQAFDAAVRKLQRGESNAVHFTVPRLSPILLEYRKHFWHQVSRKIAPNDALNIYARDDRSRLGHGAGERLSRWTIGRCYRGLAAFDTQVLLELWLYAFLSPISELAREHFRTAMKESTLFFSYGRPALPGEAGHNDH